MIKLTQLIISDDSYPDVTNITFDPTVIKALTIIDAPSSDSSFDESDSSTEGIDLPEVIAKAVSKSEDQEALHQKGARRILARQIQINKLPDKQITVNMTKPTETEKQPSPATEPKNSTDTESSNTQPIIEIDTETED